MFATTSANLSKFVHIWGCVLVDLEKPLLGQVCINMAREGNARVDVSYKSLPFGCQYYWAKGHQEKYAFDKKVIKNKSSYKKSWIG